MKCTIIFLIFFVKATFGQNDEDYNIKIVARGHMFFLKDSFKKRLSPNYDSIRYDNNFYFAFANKNIEVFTKEKAKLVLKRIRAIHPASFGSKVYQVLKGNKLFWFDKSFNLLNYDPKIISLRLVCGTVNDYTSEILERGDSTYYRFSIKKPDGKPKTIYSETNISALIEKNKLLFLNKRTKLEYDENNIFSAFLGDMIFFETTNTKTTNIIKLQKNADGTMKKIVLLEQADHVFTESLTYYMNYFAPFQFEKNNLYGYFPYNNIAKYLFLNQLIGNYARFELPNGKKGWLDVEGKEYFDKLN